MLHFKNGRVEFATFCVPKRLIGANPDETFDKIKDSIRKIEDGYECDGEFTYYYPQYVYNRTTTKGR